MAEKKLKIEGGLRTKGYFKRNSRDEPLVTILTVVFNNDKYLENTIKSVLYQSYSNIEYIIIDGGSTDKTLKIISNYDFAIDYWVSEPDEGIYDAMNKGIILSSGHIIGILNSDDYYERDTLSKVVFHFLKTKSNLMLVHGAMRKINAKGNVDSIYGSKDKMSNLLTAPFNHPTCFFHKSFYEEYGLFDTSFSTAADYDLMLRFQKKNLPSIYVNDILTNFRMTGVTSNKMFPNRQIYLLLRKNGFPIYLSLVAIAYRFFVYFLKRVIVKLRLMRLKLIIRKAIGYHLDDKDY